MKKLLTTGVIIASTAAFTSAAMAAPMMELTPAPDKQEPAQITPANGGPHKHHGLHKGKHHRATLLKSWHRALGPDRVKTPAEAKTVAEAAIILFGNPQEMKVGEIKPMKLRHGNNGYQISIVDAKGATMKTLVMSAKNGSLHAAKMMKLVKPHQSAGSQ